MSLNVCCDDRWPVLAFLIWSARKLSQSTSTVESSWIFPVSTSPHVHHAKVTASRNETISGLNGMTRCHDAGVMNNVTLGGANMTDCSCTQVTIDPELAN
jgi:hypothetical protein